MLQVMLVPRVVFCFPVGHMNVRAVIYPRHIPCIASLPRFELATATPPLFLHSSMKESGALSKDWQHFPKIKILNQPLYQSHDQSIHNILL